MTAALYAAIGLCLFESAARAEPVADADRLFERGVQGMDAGDFDAACPALADSYRLDPVPGTLFTLAECERLRHRSATALGHYEAFLARVKSLGPVERRKQRDREKVAFQQRDAMAAVAPRVVLKLAPGAAIDPDRGRVTLDSREVPLASLGVSMRLDPGSHTLLVTTPDGSLRRKISVVERDEKVIDLELPAPPPSPTEAGPRVPPPASGAPIGAYLAGGLGAAGLVVGAVGGILALSKKSEVDAGCDASKRCTPAGKQAADALKTDATLSNIGFAVGAAGIGVTLILLLTRPTDPPPTAAAARLIPLLAITGPHHAWIGIERSF